jgi:hypothetical protein
MSGKDIAKAFRSASRIAGKNATASGRTVVTKRGRRIVSITDNGQEKVVRTLDKAYVRRHTKTLKVM